MECWITLARASCTVNDRNAENWVTKGWRLTAPSDPIPPMAFRSLLGQCSFPGSPDFVPMDLP